MTNEVLALNEHNRLVELERTIEAGLKTFVIVGSALIEINNGRLYRSTHDTFERYLADRWPDISRRRAYQLMDTAAVVGNITDDVKNFSHRESHVAPLAQLPADIQPEVFKKAVETAPNGKVTAKHVERTVKAYQRQSEPDEDKQFLDELAGDGYEWSDDQEKEDKPAIELDEEEQRNAYFFGLFQDGERLYNHWFDAELPESRKKYREQLCALMERVDKER